MNTEAAKAWLDSAIVEDSCKAEIRQMDEKQREDAFYKNLEFGTGGMRGLLGAGTNRMNQYTVRRATQGLYLALDDNSRKKGVVIAYDTRHFSAEFAREAARVLLANGVAVYLFDAPRATPELSFAVRYLSAGAGIVITASHNPKEYNGYKVYGEDGGQFPPKKSDRIFEAIERLDLFSDIKLLPEEELSSHPEFHSIGAEVDTAFLTAVKRQQIDPDVILEQKDSLKVVYTPFHGAGKMPVLRILQEIGVEHVFPVEAQCVPDGAFPTVKFPNPEVPESFEMAAELAKEKDCDLIIGTDPDCDRVGVMVRDKSGNYQVLTGNQTGALLCEYILSAKQKAGRLRQNSAIVKTIVTTPLADAIAKQYGVRVIDVLTGFKYIGEVIAGFEQNHDGTYEIGFEESYGYLVGTHARDKDAVVAVMLIVEMAASYRRRGMNLYEGLCELFERYGCYLEKTISITMPGIDGMEKILSTMESLRTHGVPGMQARQVTDYLKQTVTCEGKTEPFTQYDKSNVLKYELEDGASWFVARPSGTEPKIKLYFGTMDADNQRAQEKLGALIDTVTEAVKQ